ncbi:hypothetical protein RJ641_000633 [Dillenia turbinata]|uniref:C2H2-type domain-containing protein n=1 Tax=Dillenia turbinata TaxID=194707 RepID=A0AAN8ZVX7_9MAGN
MGECYGVPLQDSTEHSNSLTIKSKIPENSDFINSKKEKLEGSPAMDIHLVEEGSQISDKKEKHTCPVCHKNFQSNKALYGHMRCHPDRFWRGINPPDFSNLNNEFSASESKYGTTQKPSLDASGSLKGWSVTGKRGRGNIRLKNPSPDNYGGRMALANEASFNSNSSSDERKRNRESEIEIDGDDDETSKRIKIRANLLSKLLKIDKTLLRDGDLLDSTFQKCLKNGLTKGWFIPELLSMNKASSNSEKDGSGSASENSSNLLDHSKGNHESAGEEDTAEVEKKQGYKCTTCNKSFPSHQALGGHRSSHNKSNSIAKNHSGSPFQDKVSSEVNELLSSGQSKAVVIEHICKTCKKTFPTGQALGGHMRLHYTPPMQLSPPPQQERENTPTTLMPRGFDLNLPAGFSLKEIKVLRPSWWMGLGSVIVNQDVNEDQRYCVCYYHSLY